MENKCIKRYNPSISDGLDTKQIEERINNNLVNHDTSVPTKSIKQILAGNFFTLFNFINLLLAIAIFAVGSYKNMLFMLVVIINTTISTYQEIHSKKIIDKLSVMASSKANVIRNGKKEEISINSIVLDDILEFNTGNQVATDCIIQDGEIEVDESFITGESDTIFKKPGDMLLSGSFIVSGKCRAKVEHIGEQNYTAQISIGAKYVKKVKSEIMLSLNKIIKFLSFAIVPIGLLLFFNQLQLTGNNIELAVVKSVAAVIGMIPEGLVLLTSTVLAVSVIRLAKSKVLVQELYCIETLARVDTLCLDKTGTLTEGSMEVKDIIPVNISKEDMINILGNLAKFSTDTNSTISAIKEYNSSPNQEFMPINIIPFSSKTKWSGIYFKNQGSYIIGAPEFVLKNNFGEYEKQIAQYSENYRVIVLAKSNNNFNDKNLPDNIELLGFVCILDKIRKEANKTLEYFAEQGVDIKIISGDNPITVSKIAKQVGVKDYDKYIDMSTLKTDEEIKKAATSYTIFGRVTPNQKKALVLALQENGRTVAMTGDGVNDVLALKSADCSIAMANGSDATKNVSQLVLLDSNFASMPKVVAEGRRTINNIERSASLFLIKTIYSSILAILFLFIGEAYPFIPIQLSLISMVTIGIPSFLLALEPNKERIKGHFLHNVISKAIPPALTSILNIVILTILNKFGIVSNEIYSSLCVISTGTVGILFLFTLAKARKSEGKKLPFSKFRLCLSIAMFILFIFCLTVFKWWFSIIPLNTIRTEALITIFVALVNFIVLYFICKKIFKIC